tara:strand:+ start:372 stop:842 length:471 start_codon:yes stop_codon:yes gene_type:complete
MRRSGTIKFVGSLTPREIGAVATATANDIDTAGFNRLLLVSSRGIGAGTVLINLLQSSSTDGGTYTTLTNGSIGTAVDIDGNTVTGASYTGLDSTIVWDIDLIQCDRFVNASILNSTTAGHMAVYGFLYSPSNLATDTEATYVKGQTTENFRYARI